jgi:hypothetical protein
MEGCKNIHRSFNFCQIGFWWHVFLIEDGQIKTIVDQTVETGKCKIWHSNFGICMENVYNF